ncbi:hypothetical protein CLOP_g3726 [Closterium sp. NIES-67]|nr:hypothetical protein CLOP_g3726 [Closterium sp. NIES-67]
MPSLGAGGSKEQGELFENQGFTPGKALFQFFSQRDMDECDYSGARKLKEFHQFGETYRVPVEAYSPGY